MPTCKISLQMFPWKLRSPGFFRELIRFNQSDEVEQAAAAQIVTDHVATGSHPHGHHFIHEAVRQFFCGYRQAPCGIPGIECIVRTSELSAHDRLDSIRPDQKIAPEI